MNTVVEVYSLKRMCRAVVGTYPPSHIEFHSFDLRDGSWLTTCDPKAKVQIEKAEVHKIRAPDGDRYVAMEPGLREILEAPFKAMVLEAHDRARAHRQDAERAIARESAFRWRLQGMPWWRRALFVLRRSNLEVR